MTNSVVPRGDPHRAVAYVRVDETSASEEAQREVILAWAAQKQMTVVAWHVSSTTASDRETMEAALEALSARQAGWFVVASLDRLHESGASVAILFNGAAHDHGARLTSADGTFEPTPGQECPVCHYPVPPTTRYPRLVCGLCMRETTDEKGRLLRFYNIDVSGGFRAEYADTGEPRAGHVCYVRGVRCVADEGYFGGIVVEAR